MTYFLLLGGNAEHGNELQSLLTGAGYQVEHLQQSGQPGWRWQTANRAHDEHQAKGHDPDRSGVNCRGVILLTPVLEPDAPHGSDGLPRLQSAVLRLARQMSQGWRLNLRQHILIGPSGPQVQLTTLEYTFIKILSMAEVGQVISRKQIVKEFGEDYLSYDQNRIDTMVRRLRKKVLDTTALKLPLSTIRVRGFAFDDVLSLDIF